MTWKVWKLDYLISHQSYNLNLKKRMCANRVLYNMFISREVIPTSSIKAVYDIVDHKSIKKYRRQDKIRFE